MRIVLLFLTLLCCCGLATAQVPSDAQVRQAYKQVRSAKEFAIGGVGIVGSLTDAEKALHVLIRAKDVRLLETLARDSNPAAQLYGLTALQYLSYPQVKQQAAALEQSRVRVETFRGCISSTEPVANIARQIAKGDFAKSLAYDIKRVATGKR